MARACAPKGALSYKERHRLPARAFALPSAKAFPLYKKVDGKLVPSRTHAINAKARAQQAFNRGDLSATTLRTIDRKADKVIQECKKNMAKAKRTKKKAASPAKQAMRSKLTKSDVQLLRRINRSVKAGEEVRKGDFADSTFKQLQSLMRRKYIQSALVRGTYMLTSKGAKAAGVKYFGKNDLKAKLRSMMPAKRKTSSKRKTEGPRRSTAKKPSKKKSSKKKASKKKASSKRRTPAQIAATKKLVAMNKKKAKKKASKKRARKKASRSVAARYAKNPRGLALKVRGSKTRVPIEVRDVPEVQNKVLILV